MDEENLRLSARLGILFHRSAFSTPVAATRLKLKTGDRIVVHGTVSLLTPQADGRTFMTVTLPSAPAPITLDASWSNREVEDLEVGDDVRLEGKLMRINPATNPRWSQGTIRIDGYGYPVTLLMSDLGGA